MKKQICLVLCIVLCLGMLSSVCFAKTEPEELCQIINPSLDQVASELDRTIDAYYNRPGETVLLRFRFTKDIAASLEAFTKYIDNNYTLYLRAVFKNNITGRDYVTVNREETFTADADYYSFVMSVSVSENARLKSEIDRLTANAARLDSYGKVRYFYNYLRNTLTYSTDVQDRSGSEVALLEHKAVCQGYARSFMELCRQAGVPALAVYSNAHMWNCVYVDGAWKMIDVTQGYFIGYDFSKLKDTDHEAMTKYTGWAQKYLAAKYRLKAEKSKISAFEDVTAKWYKGAIEFCLRRGLFQGVTPTSFEPDADMNRAMFVTVLGRMAGAKVNNSSPTKFKDVKAGEWYTGYVKWASDKGIVSGTDATHFEPDASVTREQICKMMIEYCRSSGITLYQKNPKVEFKDSRKISSWAKSYVSTCQIAGLVNGDNGYFKPQGKATRAEVATILNNFCVNYAL